jgi:hypothetical protein
VLAARLQPRGGRHGGGRRLQEGWRMPWMELAQKITELLASQVSS